MVSGDIRPLRHSYRLGDYLADAREQNVIRSVHIEAGWDPKQPVMETEWLQGLADEHGHPQGIVASARLDAPDVEDIIARHVEQPNVRGIRQILSWHEDPVLCQCDTHHWTMRACAQSSSRRSRSSGRTGACSPATSRSTACTAPTATSSRRSAPSPKTSRPTSARCCFTKTPRGCTGSHEWRWRLSRSSEA